jgi:hypothetical protein
MSEGKRQRRTEIHSVLSSNGIGRSYKTFPMGKITGFKINIGRAGRRLTIRFGKKTSNKKKNEHYGSGLHLKRVVMGVMGVQIKTYGRILVRYDFAVKIIPFFSKKKR